MIRGTLTLLAAALSACGGGGGASAPATGATPTPAPTLSFAVRGESRILTGTTPVPLMQPVGTVRAVYGYDAVGARVDYAASDWTVSAAGIARTNGSRIPDFATYRYLAQPDGRFDFSPEPRNPPDTVTRAIYVDYDAPVPDRNVVARAPSARNARVLCLGDSIAAGAHTVANYFAGTDSESWCGLLRKRLGPSAKVDNPAVPGGAIGSVVANLEALVATRPDTVVLAMGMNDHLGGTAGLAAFQDGVDRVVTRFRATGARVILLGFFQQNRLWTLEDPIQTVAYNDAIAAVARARDVPFVDVRTAFERVRPSGAEAFFHVTGDFMHHPNTYGQRIYFSLLVPYFLTVDTPASMIEDYVLYDW